MSSKYVGKLFCMITGSSSGFGQSLAQTIVKEKGLLSNASSGSKIVLLSRNTLGMDNTVSSMKEMGHNMGKFDIEQLPIDLSNTSITESKLSDFLSKESKDFETFVLFNNAGVLGDITTDFPDRPVKDYENWFNVNMVSPVFLITQLCKHFSESSRTIVQTSSIGVIRHMPCMSTYCSAKAGMDMFMKCISADHPDITTFSYSPGPMDTAMGNTLRLKHKIDSTRQHWEELKANNTIVKPLDSAEKLCNILQRGDFESGDFVDFNGRNE